MDIKTIDLLLDRPKIYFETHKERVPIYRIIDSKNNVYLVRMSYNKRNELCSQIESNGFVIISISRLNRFIDCGTWKKPIYSELYGRLRYTPKSRLHKFKEEYPAYFI